MFNTFSIRSEEWGHATKADGRAILDFNMPTQLFTDGFKSGDVSVWSLTTAKFTNVKKANNARMDCNNRKVNPTRFVP